MPARMPRQPRRTSQQHYLRLLKRRQRTSLWLERLAWVAVLVALVCLLAEQLTGAPLAWWLGLGSLLLALLFIVVEALDAAHEARRRQQQANLQREEEGSTR